MIDALATSTGFTAMVAFFVLGLSGALLWRKHDTVANIWSHACAILGSIWGLTFALSVFASGHDVLVRGAASSFPFLSVTFRVDKLSSFFIFVICLVALFCSTYGLGYVRDFYKRYSIGSLGFFYNLFIGAMLLVVSASNAVLFLAVWEIMTLASYFLVVYDRHDHQNVKAGFLYLVMTHLGTTCILLAFMILSGYAHSFDFVAIKAAIPHMPGLVKDVVFGLALLGFGTKAGVIPMHTWLPSAHPAAPSHVSGLMSGVMIKTGIYMMIRLFLDILQPVPVWWGLAVLVLGSVSCLLGVLYALTEHDIKRLLAYHSIENIGIILLGLGGALTFASLQQPALALLSLAALLFHTLNHATFKSLLFLAAGSVVHAMHSRNIEKYGGLIKYMPLTALLFLVGSMAISALPPFNGFFSEWLTFQALFHGASSSNFYVKWVFLLAISVLALTGGLALACFVKAYGATFLARPRSEVVKRTADPSKWMAAGMVGLAVVCLSLGMGAAAVSVVLQKVGQQVMGLPQHAPLLAATHRQTLEAGHGYAAVSAPAVLLFLVGAVVLVWAIVRFGINRKQKVIIDRTWDCGTDLTERMEITATGMSRSIVLIFRKLLRPSLRHDIQFAPGGTYPYAPVSRTVHASIPDVYHKYFYDPLFVVATALSKRVKMIQNGNLNAYLLYVFVILIIMLLVGL